MRKIAFLIPVIALVAAIPAGARSQKRYITPEEVHETVSPAAQRKADALYESVRKAHAAGSLSADAVVDKALYHGVWSPQLAERCLRLVSAGSKRAKAEIGHLYTFSKTAYLFPGKEAEGVKLMEEAAAAGYAPAHDYLCIYHNSKKNYAQALKHFNAAGSTHVPYALSVVGEMYEDGHGVKKDRATARQYFERAAMLGDAFGAAKYGSALQKAWYGTVDMPDAFFWTYIAGDLGSDFARSNLRLPLRGERFGDDKNTAFVRNSFILTDSWNDQYGHRIEAEPIYQEGYKKGLAFRGVAAEKGDPWSLFYLGSMSNNDEILNRNDDFISECYEPLIKAGNKLPPAAMALVYERMARIYSQGAHRNPALAADYNRKAAALGSLAAYKIVEKIPD